MQLSHDWKAILVRAWSVRLMVLAAILSGAEVALPFFAPAWPSGAFAALSGFLTASALIARVVMQKDLET